MLPKKVNIVEVGPRDGLQNEASIIPTALKINFIKALATSGLRTIEATSFVSPRWVPQMADHAQVLAALDLSGDIRYPVLVPNLQGLQAALKLGVKDIAVFTTASEAFSLKNTNCSIAKSIERINAVVSLAKAHNVNIRGYISCVLGCPYSGEVAISAVADIATALLELGVYEVSLGDTIGVGTPERTSELIQTLSNVVPIDKLAIHAHDTNGRALDNIEAALELGISTIDSSAAGLGGCPYAPGASGNVATERVLTKLDAMQIKTGVTKSKIIAAAQPIVDFLQHLAKPTGK